MKGNAVVAKAQVFLGIVETQSPFHIITDTTKGDSESGVAFDYTIIQILLNQNAVGINIISVDCSIGSHLTGGIEEVPFAVPFYPVSGDHLTSSVKEVPLVVIPEPFIGGRSTISKEEITFAVVFIPAGSDRRNDSFPRCIGFTYIRIRFNSRSIFFGQIDETIDQICDQGVAVGVGMKIKV